MPKIQIPNGWEPRWYQRKLWDYLQNGGKRAVAVWHRRAGKDDVALHWAAVSALTKPATYWHMLPEAAQARKAIWEAVDPHTGRRRIDIAFPKEIRDTTRDQEMFIRLVNGATWQVVGSDNYDSLVGSPPYGVVFSEWALAKPAAWAFMRPILRENGGWASFIYTARGNNHGKTTFDLSQQEPSWFGQILPATDTDVFTAEELEAERREYIADYGEDVGDALFRQEYLCSFNAPLLGAYYGRLIEQAELAGRFVDDLYDPSLPVHTAWDLGVGDSTAIWFFQVHANEIRFIDYYESSGVGADHYVEVIDGKGYRYATHWLPHDAKVREWTGAARTRIEFLQSMGLTCGLVADHKIDDGINAARLTIEAAWFDRTKCHQGLEALKLYRRKYDEDRKVFLRVPLHDWTSHSADAFRYAAMTWRELKAEPIKSAKRGMTAEEAFFPTNTKRRMRV